MNYVFRKVSLETVHIADTITTLMRYNKDLSLRQAIFRAILRETSNGILSTILTSYYFFFTSERAKTRSFLYSDGRGDVEKNERDVTSRLPLDQLLIARVLDYQVMIRTFQILHADFQLLVDFQPRVVHFLQGGRLLFHVLQNERGTRLFIKRNV